MSGLKIRTTTYYIIFVSKLYKIAMIHTKLKISSICDGFDEVCVTRCITPKWMTRYATSLWLEAIIISWPELLASACQIISTIIASNYIFITLRCKKYWLSSEVSLDGKCANHAPIMALKTMMVLLGEKDHAPPAAAPLYTSSSALA